MSIQIKRGMKKDLPQLKDGELAFCKDTKELYVGNNGNENVNIVSDVSIANTSEELINENVVSFKVGTSNVTGVDLTNQMEQSLVSLDNIEGKSVREEVNDDYKKIIKCITLGGLELKSLPKGTKDTYSNSIYTKRINRVYFKDLKWEYYADGLVSTKTTIYKAMIPDMSTCGDANSVTFNFNCSRYDVVSANAQWGKDEECMSMHPFNKGVYLRVSKSAIKSGSDISKFLGFHYIDYELENPIENLYELNFLCEPGDIIGLDNPVPFTCSHTVQLNTKAQVEETQKQIIQIKKSIWQKLKELTDVEMNFKENGYIKLPTALGGLILQWGKISFSGSGSSRDAWRDVTYPIPFKKQVYHHSATLYSTAWINCGTTGEGLTTLRVWAVGLESGSILSTEPLYFTWFAIGK